MGKPNISENLGEYSKKSTGCSFHVLLLDGIFTVAVVVKEEDIVIRQNSILFKFHEWSSVIDKTQSGHLFSVLT